VYLLLFVTLLERINSKFNVKTVSYEKHAKQKLIHLFIGNLYIFPLISSSDIVSINLMTLILENISQCHITIWYLISNTTITSILKLLTNIITSIIARPIRLAAKLVIMSVSTFKTDVILYLLQIFHLEEGCWPKRWCIYRN
jgi:hypothetical protein